jgi:hypothetical protein
MEDDHDLTPNRARTQDGQSARDGEEEERKSLVADFTQRTPPRVP